MRFRDFKIVKETTDDELFGSLFDRIAGRFTYPEDGPLGYVIGGGEGSYGNGHASNGVVILNREDQEIAFIPDFTYFDEEPTQEDLGELFYYDGYGDPEDATKREPITMANVRKFANLNEDDMFSSGGMSTKLAKLIIHDYQGEMNWDWLEDDASFTDFLDSAGYFSDERLPGLDNYVDQLETKGDYHNFIENVVRLVDLQSIDESDDDMFANRQPDIETELNTIWRKIEDIVGRIYPDGDPIDYLGPWITQKGYPYSMVDAACKKNGYNDIYAYWKSIGDDLGYVDEAFNESDDDLFAQHRTPPKNARQLYAWAQGNNDRRPFFLIAEFALNNGLTLKNALELAQGFDYASEEVQDQFGISEDEMLELFDAYEEIYDAWNTDPSGDTSSTDSWDSLNEAEVELDEPPAPERKQQTKTKTKPDVKFDPFQQQQDRPLANRPEEPKGSEKTAGPTMRKASAAGTRQATAGVRLPPEAMRHLDNLRNIEIDPDLPGFPDEEPRLDISTQVNTENLPAVAGEALQAAGMTSPEFHQVARLPGNMSAMIRQLGKKLFGSMTNTPTEQIYMIGNLGGQGPNTRQEVNAVANFAQQNGEDMGPGDIDFNAIMPGYTAETHQYSAAGIRFLLVKDFAGQYIYCWPEAESKTLSSQAQLGNV